MVGRQILVKISSQLPWDVCNSFYLPWLSLRRKRQPLEIQVKNETKIAPTVSSTPHAIMWWVWLEIHDLILSDYLWSDSLEHWLDISACTLFCPWRFLSFPSSSVATLIYASTNNGTSTCNYNIVRPVARIFRRGVTWVCDVYICMHKHARL